MSLTDGAVADLARQAADLLGPDVSVRIRPPGNDDPYRWGGHGWVITIDDRDEIWIPVEATPEEALAKLREGVRPGGAVE
ncbi:MAG: hypothetical protein QOH89_1938 [Pseudonocardiales bacterium]|jgi:hypothetical protein|nr:hypothetical protein [Pseudonocardiales bacterium]MDT4943070.1 hypothetical protein [Pseudonocardiales bacterium]